MTEKNQSLQTKVSVTDPVDYGYSAQDMCMLSSMRSRLPVPIEQLHERVAKEGSDRFTKQFYLPYGGGSEAGKVPGHGSIAQSGSTTIELEGVSMLTALAFEDHQLFNGQECSTRYIDYNTAGYVIPKLHDKDQAEGINIINEWFMLYNQVLEGFYKHLVETIEKPDDLDQKVFEKALRAKAYDKASGFLPAAAKTNLSWHTHIDNANTQIQRLKYYPLMETREIAEQAEDALAARYPNSVKRTLPEGHAEFLNNQSVNINYSELSIQAIAEGAKEYIFSEAAESQTAWSLDSTQNKDMPVSMQIYSNVSAEIVESLPKYMYAPNILKSAGSFQIQGCLDLASFRELHRHRDGHIPVPYIHASSGMHSWYTQGLPADLQALLTFKIPELLDRCLKVYKRNPYEAQYLLPLGIRVAVELNWSFPQLMYVIYRRSTHSCREPIRKFAHALYDMFIAKFPGAAVYPNLEPEQPFYYERGHQDVMRKKRNGELVEMSKVISGEVSEDELMPLEEIETESKQESTKDSVNKTPLTDAPVVKQDNSFDQPGLPAPKTKQVIKAYADSLSLVTGCPTETQDSITFKELAELLVNYDNAIIANTEIRIQLENVLKGRTSSSINNIMLCAIVSFLKGRLKSVYIDLSNNYKEAVNKMDNSVVIKEVLEVLNSSDEEAKEQLAEDDKIELSPEAKKTSDLIVSLTKVIATFDGNLCHVTPGSPSYKAFAGQIEANADAIALDVNMSNVLAEAKKVWLEMQEDNDYAVRYITDALIKAIKRTAKIQNWRQKELIDSGETMLKFNIVKNEEISKIIIGNF